MDPGAGTDNTGLHAAREMPTGAACGAKPPEPGELDDRPARAERAVREGNCRGHRGTHDTTRETTDERPAISPISQIAGEIQRGAGRPSTTRAALDRTSIAARAERVHHGDARRCAGDAAAADGRSRPDDMRAAPRLTVSSKTLSMWRAGDDVRLCVHPGIPPATRRSSHDCVRPVR